MGFPRPSHLGLAEKSLRESLGALLYLSLANLLAPLTWWEQKWTKESVVTYHWGPIDLCVAPAVLGYFPEEMMTELVEHGGKFLAGGGLYVSDKQIDTMSYGSCRLDVALTLGSPYVTVGDEGWIAELLGIEKYVEKYYPSLGGRFPLFNYHYISVWSVFYNASLTTNVTAGKEMAFHQDVFRTMFQTMYPVYSGIGSAAGGPKITAINSLIGNLREIVLGYIGSENPLRWLAALQQSPTDILGFLQPNATSRDWDLLEKLLVDSLNSKKKIDFPNSNRTLIDEQFLTYYIPILMGGPVPLTPAGYWEVIRDHPYTDEVWATGTYLRFLETSPFVDVVSIKETMNVTTSAGEKFSLSKVLVRGISAYRESDWKKLFQSGVLPSDGPLLKLLLDDTICCASNKTQLLIIDALRAIGSKGPTVRGLSEVVSAAFNLSWVLPFKESAVPPWISRSLARFSFNDLPYYWNPAGDHAAYSGMAEAIQHVRPPLAKWARPSPTTS